MVAHGSYANYLLRGSKSVESAKQTGMEVVHLQSKAEKDKEVNSHLSGLRVPSVPKNQTLRVKLHEDDVFI